MTICLLLAAGSSSRMKNHPEQLTIPKMLLQYKGKTFLQHIIDETNKLSDAALLIVTGSYHSQIKESIQQQQITLIQNKHWQEGMGSSIQKGITHITEHHKNADNVILMVCDQPFITAALLQQMRDTKNKTGKGIVACTYAGTTGTPVLFDKKYFNILAELKGNFGAKYLLKKFHEDIAVIEFAEGAIDIDTPEDYKKLIKALYQPKIK